MTAMRVGSHSSTQEKWALLEAIWPGLEKPAVKITGKSQSGCYHLPSASSASCLHTRPAQSHLPKLSLASVPFPKHSGLSTKALSYFTPPSWEISEQNGSPEE